MYMSSLKCTELKGTRTKCTVTKLTSTKRISMSQPSAGTLTRNTFSEKDCPFDEKLFEDVKDYKFFLAPSHRNLVIFMYIVNKMYPRCFRVTNLNTYW